MAKKRRSKSSAPMLLLWAAVVFVFGAIAGTMVQTGCDWTGSESAPSKVQPKDGRNEKKKDQKGVGGGPAPVEKEQKRSPRPDRQAETADDIRAGTKPQPLQTQLPHLALVIDDLGQAETQLIQRLCSLDVPFTVAVLPLLPHSQESARIAKSKGKEVILHMPMEPIGYPGQGKNPGLGAILFDQSESDVRKNVSRAIADIPFAVGLNNHMGSRITPDRTRMAWILDEAKKSGLYFLDSRTEKDTVALDVAMELGVPALGRKVFLDDSLDPAAMAQQWGRAIAMAKHDTGVVIIGHIHPETVSFLEKALPAAKGEVAFVRASTMLKGMGSR